MGKESIVSTWLRNGCLDVLPPIVEGQAKEILSSDDEVEYVIAAVRKCAEKL